jgi:ABC-type amino acid transport substrate-binding protein
VKKGGKGQPNPRDWSSPFLDGRRLSMFVRKQWWLLAIVVVGAFLTAPIAGGGGAATPTPPPSIQDGVLKAVTNMSLPPHRYIKNGKFGGFEIEMTNLIAKRLGFKRVQWSNSAWDLIMTSVSAGKYDVGIAGINGWSTPNTPIYDIVKQRTKIVSFSRPYFRPFWVIVTSKTHHPEIKNVNQLQKGMKIIQLDGASEFFWAKKNLAPKGIEIRATTTASNSFAAVESGLVDATIEEGTALPAILKAHPDLQGGDPVPGLTSGFSYAFAPDSNALRQAFNREFGKLVSSGTYAKMFKKYFPWLKVPNLPTSSFIHQ